MAFGKKYFSSYKSNNNLDYYLEIFLEDYTGSALELVMGAGGPVIEYETDQEDRFSPIISSSCKIPYLVENYLDSLFIDDLRNNYQERQVYVHIYRSTQSGSSAVAPLWSGFLVMDIGSGVDKYFPYEEHLKFVDGLSLLKDIDFVDLGVTGGSPPFEERVQGNYAQENMYFGPATYIYWIREILAKSGAALTNQGASQNYGFTTSVNWYNGEMNTTGQSSDPLHKTKCAVSMFHKKDDQGVFYPDNCYNVLKELLRHWGARITYWKHEFWIVQIPEYITSETGTISTPVNNNSRLYSNTGAYQGSQNHLGSTYYTRYEQTIENDKISKLSGTKYDYLPLIKQVNADFLSFSSKSYFGGFPFGATATTQEVFQGTINSPSAADFLYLSIPLDWTWDLSNAPNFPNGHTNGWWCSIKFNFYASDGTTTYYLQYDSGTGNYFWVDSATWTPLGNGSPKYIISSKLADVTGHIGFEQQIPFEDENGNAISMSGAWSFFLDIEDYGTGNSNPGSFYINFSGYGSPQRMRNPGNAIQLPAGSGVMSGTVSWSNTLVDQQGQVTISSINNPAGFNAGTVNPDIRFATTSPFTGLLQTLNNAQSASNGETFNVINSNTQAKQNSEQYDFGTLLWGDSLEFAPSSLQVFDGSTYVNTEPSGEWGRGVLTGTKTFTKILIDEFFSGQTKIIISPSMRLAVGVANKNEDQGGTIRPRYVNPIGKLRETRDGTDPEYFFRRGSFYTLLDEWDYEGYEIIRNVPSTTTQSNGMGSMGGSQSGSPAPSGMSPSPMVQALSQNSPLAYIRTTIPATGSNVAVNGNFNTAVGWTLGTGWSIDTTAKKAKFAATGSTSELTQSVLTQGLTYQVNFQVEVTAGTLLVKAGTSGTSQSITSSGDYSIYLDCEGSSLIKFQAGTTFTGNITYITLKDQKSLSSVPIEAIGTAVFKSGDTFNLINSNDDTILPLTVTSNQGSTDTTISVSSTPLYEDIDNGSYLLINQDDLSAQYQNKTKGTVGGFDITATSIDSGSVAISSYIDDDTFATASATSLATSESIKAYVDGQAGHSETLQGVTDNGNTTTNSIMIGSSSSPQELLHLRKSSTPRLLFTDDTTGHTDDDGFFIGLSAGQDLNFWNYENTAIRFATGSTERMRLTSGGNLGINESNPASKLEITGGNIQLADGWGLRWDDAANTQLLGSAGDGFKFSTGGSEKMRLTSGGNLGLGESNPSAKMHINITSEDNQPALLIEKSSDKNETALVVKHISTSNLRGIADFQNTNSSVMKILADGNVGINTLSPTEKLHVVGDALITGDSHADAFKPAVSGNPIKFKNFGSTEVARITDGGFLGLNETSPNYIIDANITSSRIRFKAVTGNANLELSCIAGRDWLVSSITDGSFRIYDEDATASRLLINSSGKINFSAYGSGSFTGTETYFLAVTSGGDVVEADSSALPGGPYLPLTGGTLTGGLTGTTGTFSGDLQVDGGDVTIIKQNDAPTITLLHDGTNPTTNDLLFRMQFQSDYNGSHENWGKIELDTNASNVRTNMDFYVKSTSGAEQLALSLEGQPSAVPNSLFYGNVLIGTTVNSGEKLVVNGNAKFADQVTIPATPVASTDAASKSYVDAQVGSADTLQEVTDNGNTTTNSIMIGSSSSPDGKLHIQNTIVNGGGAQNILILDGIENGGDMLAGDGPRLLFKIPYNSLDSKVGASIDAIKSMNADSYSNTDLVFNISENNETLNEAIRIKSNSNVLIGTTTDSGDKLNVVGDVLFQNSNAPNLNLYRSGTGQLWNLQIDSSGRLQFKEAASFGGTKNLRLQIDDTGEVEVYNNFTGTSATFSGNVFSETYRSSRTDGDIYIQATTASDFVAIGTQVSGQANLMRVLGNGNVLIGTTTDSGLYKLDVNGKQRVQSVLELDDVLTLNAISTPSDPASGKSSIYMDSADGAIKVKINVGGTVVTRTIASFEG